AAELRQRIPRRLLRDAAGRLGVHQGLQRERGLAAARRPGAARRRPAGLQPDAPARLLRALRLPGAGEPAARRLHLVRPGGGPAAAAAPAAFTRFSCYGQWFRPRLVGESGALLDRGKETMNSVIRLHTANRTARVAAGQGRHGAAPGLLLAALGLLAVAGT